LRRRPGKKPIARTWQSFYRSSFLVWSSQILPYSDQHLDSTKRYLLAPSIVRNLQEQFLTLMLVLA